MNTKKLTIYIFSFVMLFISSTRFAKAATYYVSPTGNDSNAGSQALPWKTIKKAANTVAAGDTVYVRQGTYNEQVYLGKSGTQAAPIKFVSYPSEVATIDGNNTLPGNQYSSLVNISGSYTYFQNFEVKNSNGRGVQLNGSYSQLTGSNIHHIFDSGVYVYGSHNLVENNRIWRAIESNYNRDHGDWSVAVSWGAAQSPDVAPFTTVRKNQIYQNSGEGVGCMYTHDAVIDGNVVYDNWAMNIYLDTCSNVTISNNMVYYTTDKQFWRYSTAPQGGIVLANESIQSYPLGHSRRIFNNILVGNGTNIGFWIGKAAGAALNDDQIFNNTLVNAYEESFGIDSAPHQGVQIKNNLVYQEKGSAAKIYGGGVSYSNNLWYPLTGPTGTGDILSNPLLKSPNATVAFGQVDPISYTLTSSSPAINKGLTLSEAATDYFGNARTGLYDIGAVEYQSPVTASIIPSVLPSPSFKPGDANQDGFVNNIDYVQYFLPNYLKSATGIIHGDFNNDNYVDGIDYVVWLNNTD